MSVAYLAWSSGSWSTPLSSGHNSQLSSSLTATVNKNQWLAANRPKLHSLHSSFSPLSGLKLLLCQIATFKNVLIKGCGQCFWGVAKNFARALCAFGLAPPFLKPWIRHWVLRMHCVLTHPHAADLTQLWNKHTLAIELHRDRDTGTLSTNKKTLIFSYCIISVYF